MKGTACFWYIPRFLFCTRHQSRLHMDISNFIYLRDVILNNESRSARSASITAEDLQEISTEVMVVIGLEAQTELGDIGEIDVLEVRRSQRLREPITDHAISKGQYVILAGSRLKVVGLQGGVIGKRTLADIRHQIAMSRERQSPDLACILEFESSGSNDRVIGERRGIEGEDSAVLFISRIISEVDSGGSGVDGTAFAAGLGGFKDLTILSGSGDEGSC